MKKKIVLGMGMLLLLGCLTACGKTGNGKESNEASNTASNVEQSKEDKKKEDPVYVALAEKYEDTLRFEYIENNFNYTIKMMSYRHGTQGYGYSSLDRTPEGKLIPGTSGELFVTQYSGDVGGGSLR